MAKVKYIRGVKVPKAKSAMSAMDVEMEKVPQTAVPSATVLGAQTVPSTLSMKEMQELMEMKKEKMMGEVSLGPTEVTQNGITRIAGAKVKRKKPSGK